MQNVTRRNARRASIAKRNVRILASCVMGTMEALEIVKINGPRKNVIRNVMPRNVRRARVARRIVRTLVAYVMSVFYRFFKCKENTWN